MALEDIVMAIQNEIAENYLIDLSSSGSLKRYECADSILVPHIHINSETWDGGHTYITITFYDYKTDQSIAVVKSSGIGISVSQDQSIALKAIKKKLRELFK